MEIIIITGPPYSGKGTQCEILKEKLKYTHISTGDRCREEKQKGTEIGLLMKQYEEKGNLVPDSVMKELFARIMDENLEKDFILLDGYPRTSPQVDDLIDLVKAKELKIKRVLSIEVPKLELLDRAHQRALISNRADDQNPQTHLKRIEVFEASTRPAIEYMKSKFEVVSVDGLGRIDEISKVLIDALG